MGSQLQLVRREMEEMTSERTDSDQRRDAVHRSFPPPPVSDETSTERTDDLSDLDDGGVDLQ